MSIDRLIIALLATTLIVSGCSTVSPRDKHQSWTAERYQEEARTAMRLGNYGTAADYLQELTIRYPLSPLTREAYLQIAYAHYKNLRYDAAIAAADHYLVLYPDDQDAAYAYYLRGLADFDRGIHALEQPVNIEDPDITLRARASYESFAALIQRYPNSNYARDAELRIKVLRDRLAKHELALAELAAKQGNDDSARARARYIAEQYTDTGVAADAMRLLVQLNHAQEQKAQPSPTAAAKSETLAEQTKAEQAGTEAEPIDEEASPAAEPSAPDTEQPESTPATIATPQPKIDITAPAAAPRPTAEESKHVGSYFKGLRDEAWLLRQRGNYYTLQIAGTSQPRWLRNFVDQHDIGQDVAYYRKRNSKNNWYVVLYGLYANISDARAARRDALNQLGIKDAWIRPLREVQKDIKSGK